MLTGRLCTLGLAIVMFACLTTAQAANRQVDSDSDGLSDFQEIHKYLTDPHNPDTDGDGIPDGDWKERREYAYTIRTVLRFMPPFSEAALNDDYQDARLISKTNDYIDLEVIHYPLSTAGSTIDSDPNWQKDDADMPELRPGITTNWDAKMREDVKAELKSAGIDIDKLTDKEVVEQVSTWAIRRGRYLENAFTTWYVYFPDGKPAVYPGLEKPYKNDFARDTYTWTIDEQPDHEVLGRGMYYNKTHGSCTSSAIYLTTVLRAVGIPTRMVMACPAVDASDPAQRKMLRDGLNHHQVRFDAAGGIAVAGWGFSNHTFNEVFVGGRWHRLNYNRLGQPIVDRHFFGLMTHLYTMNDLSDLNLAATWGKRYGLGLRETEFKYSNPYKALELSDQFGVHAKVPNPPAVRPASHRSQPDLCILHPLGLPFNPFDSIVSRLADTVGNKTGREHLLTHYEEVFDESSNLQPGDLLILLFTLDTTERIPAGYGDLLPRPWPQIEEMLKQGKSVELSGDARGLKVTLLATPHAEELQNLIASSRLLPTATRPAGTQPPRPTGRRGSKGPKPNMGMLTPAGLPFSSWEAVCSRLEGAVASRTGRLHSPELYDYVLGKSGGLRPGDLLVLLFTLDTSGRVAPGYEDLLPKPWPHIEERLKAGETVELEGKARGLRVVLLATPKAQQLEMLIQHTRLLELPAGLPTPSSQPASRDTGKGQS